MLTAGKKHLSRSQHSLLQVSRFHKCHGADRCPRAELMVCGEEYQLVVVFSSCLPRGCWVSEGLNPTDVLLIPIQLPVIVKSCQTSDLCSLFPAVSQLVLSSGLPGEIKKEFRVFAEASFSMQRTIQMELSLPCIWASWLGTRPFPLSPAGHVLSCLLAEWPSLVGWVQPRVYRAGTASSAAGDVLTSEECTGDFLLQAIVWCLSGGGLFIVCVLIPFPVYLLLTDYIIISLVWALLGLEFFFPERLKTSDGIRVEAVCLRAGTDSPG